MEDILLFLASALVAAFLILTRNVFSPIWLLFVSLLLLYRIKEKTRLASNLYRCTVLVIFLYFFVKYQGLFIPFVAAIILAYILSPLVGLLEKIKIRKVFASFVVVVVVWFSLLYLLYLIIPPFISEARNLITSLSQPIPHIYKFIESVFAQLKTLGVDVNFETINKTLDGLLNGLIENFGKGIGTTIHLVFYLILIPVATYYFLVDGEKMIRWFHHFIPADQRDKIIATLSRIDRGMSEFLRAEIFLCLIVGLITGFLLFLAGIKYYILLGIIAALANFIPTIGFYLSIIPAFLVALTSPNIGISIIKVLAIYLGESVIEALFLVPKIIGDASRLHPLTVIFALLLGASLFGFWGIVIAIPLTIVIREIMIQEDKLPKE